MFDTVTLVLPHTVTLVLPHTITLPTMHVSNTTRWNSVCSASVNKVDITKCQLYLDVLGDCQRYTLRLQKCGHLHVYISRRSIPWRSVLRVIYFLCSATQYSLFGKWKNKISQRKESLSFTFKKNV